MEDKIIVRTVVPKVENHQRKWYVVDAENQILGRIATQVAAILRGKHKPVFTPHLDMGDHVIVVNAEKIKVTGNKLDRKKYTRYTGYPGGLKTVTFNSLFKEYPERVMVKAIKGMLPKNRLGRKMIKKLRVYTGPDHPHQAQKPEVLPNHLRKV